MVYTINDPDSNWDNVVVRCEQIYEFAKKSRREVTGKIQVHCKWIENYPEMEDLNIDLDKPKVRIESQNLHSLTVNSTAIFRCIVHGNPPPDFR